MNKTGIEWCDFTWNPIVGCTFGCPWCYARRMAKRFKHLCEKCYTFEPHLHPERLEEPANRKKPARIFVCSMGDLFDPATEQPGEDGNVDPAWKRVMLAMYAASQHQYVVLTKRPDIMAERLESWIMAPQQNWVLMTSVTNQADVEKCVPEMMGLGAAGWTVGVSVEPMLGPVDLGHIRTGPNQRMHGYSDVFWYPLGNALRQYKPKPNVIAPPAWQGLRWVIVGAQTGPGAKALPHSTWVKQIITDCRAAGVPVFVKDNVAWLDVVREWPESLTRGEAARG